MQAGLQGTCVLGVSGVLHARIRGTSRTVRTVRAGEAQPLPAALLQVPQHRICPRTGAWFCIVMVEKIGANNIKAFITGSAANAKACGQALEAKYPHTIWMPCTAHCIDLLLEDFGKLDWAAEIIQKGKVVKFFKAHQWTLAELRRISEVKLKLLPPGDPDTRFGTEFLMLSRSVEKLDDLQVTVHSTVWLAHAVQCGWRTPYSV
eukprot:355048-Chlamydomonas_euryale.AAC.1